MSIVTIGVDPDTKTTGIALLVDGEPEAVFVAKAGTKGKAYERAEVMAQAVTDIFEELVSEWPIDEVVIEWHLIRKSDLNNPKTRHAKCQGMLDLMAVSGMALASARSAFRGAKISRPYPHDWKPSIPKEIHQNRLRKLFDSDLIHSLPKGQQSHVLDACGLAHQAYKARLP